MEKEDEEQESVPPLRDTSGLFVSTTTLACARQCVPCAYKVGLFDVALDKEFCSLVPNQRPEQCKRAKDATIAANGELGYRKGMSILTVGDGDFSFSLALARIVRPHDHGTRFVATSFESEETLLQVYPDIQGNLEELRSLGATIYYNVDATRLRETLPSLENARYHRVCWNFPCSAIARGQDGQNKEMEYNKTLVRRFVANTVELLTPLDGEIHICHKTKPPFNQWKLEQVALEDVPESALLHVGRVVLDRYLMPPYTPRKALDRKSFPCHDACFYIFARRVPETTPRTTATTPFAATLATGKLSMVSSVTPQTILSLRRSHIKSRRIQSSKVGSQTTKKRRLR